MPDTPYNWQDLAAAAAVRVVPKRWFESRTILLAIFQTLAGVTGIVMGLSQGNAEMIAGGIAGASTGVGIIYTRAVATRPIGRP